MKKFLITLVLVLSLFATYFNFSVLKVNADTRKLEIVALGDSITTGCNLDGYDSNAVKTNTTIRNYANLVAENKDANLINLAHDGDKVEDLLQVVNNEDNLEAISKADVMLVSIGGNELLDPLIQVITQQVMMKMFMGSDVTINDLITALNSNSQTFLDAISAYEQKLPSLLTALKEKNSEAQVILQTLYNPLENAKNSNLVLSISIEENNTDIDELYDVFDTYIQQLNTVTKTAIQNQSNSNIVCCDIYNAFRDYATKNDTELLTNIDGENITDFDIHPNLKGHNVIYQNVVKVVRDKPVVRVMSSTVYIYTNGVLVNDPNLETDISAGGSIEDSIKNEDGYDIFEVSENESKFAKIIEETGYKLTDVKLDGNSVGVKKSVALKGSEMPAVIEVYFLQEYSVIFNIGLNGEIIVDDEVLEDASTNLIKTVLYNGSISCNIKGKKGYEINEILINSEKLSNTNISTYTFREIKEDKSFTVTFKKIEKTEYVNDIYDIKLSASTDSIPYGTSLIVQTITVGEKYDRILESIEEYIANAKIYNFSLSASYNENSSTSISPQPEGDITISIPVPETFDKEKVKLFYVSDGYVAEELNFSIDEENYLSFVTNHCSYYVLLEVGSAPKSYVWLYILIGVVVLLAISSVVAVLIVKKRNQDYKKKVEMKAKSEYISY